MLIALRQAHSLQLLIGNRIRFRFWLKPSWIEAKLLADLAFLLAAAAQNLNLNLAFIADSVTDSWPNLTDSMRSGQSSRNLIR